MKSFLQLCLLFLVWAPRLAAAELPQFLWDAEADRVGLDIRGEFPWDQQSCDFEDTQQPLRPFPVFSYKGPSGKPLKDPTGAFCFTLQMPAERLGTLLRFSMVRVFGTAELRINGEQVWHQNSETGPQRFNILHDVKSEKLQVELRLQCGQAPSCGFRGALHIKEQRQGSRDELLLYAYDLLALAGILSCLFYHLIFAFLRRRSSTAFFLCVTAIALILRLVLTGHGQLHYFFGLSEGWYWRFETIAVYLLLPATISLAKTVFEQEAPKSLSMLGWVIVGVSSFFLALDARIFLFLLIIVYVLVVMNLVNFGLLIPKALRNRRSGSSIMVVSASVAFTSTLFEVLNSRLNIEMHAATQPVFYLATMIFQSVLLATRINDAFILAEQQEAEIKILKEKIEVEIRSLDQKILERTMELRTIFQSISTGILWISRNEQNELMISSEYSDHLRRTIGFDIQAWHEMHFFLRRMRLPDLPRSGPEIAAWFRKHWENPDELDRALEDFLGGVRVFHDLDTVKHLKFKWIPILENGRVIELFLFVFDVSLSIEMQDLARYRTMEIEALRELTRLPGGALEDVHQVFGESDLAAIRQFAGAHQLKHLEQALTVLQNEKHLDKFLQAYRRVLTLLAERQIRARQQASFDYESFLLMEDWQNLPVDARNLFQELVRARIKERLSG